MIMKEIDFSRYKQITDNIAKIVHAKNTNYDRAFEKSFDKYGWATYFIRIGDKLNRLEALTLGKRGNLIQDESIEDTLTDIIGYSLLLLEILKREENKND